MSHYACAVLTDGTKTVEELMAPYQENNMETVPREYLEFHDITDEYREEYESHCDMTFYLDPEEEGITLRWKYNDEFKTVKHLAPDGGITRHDVPEGNIVVNIPLKLVYPTFEDYMRLYCGYEPTDDGRYGYWENPNDKWDWYKEGGRFAKWANEAIGGICVRVGDIRYDSEYWMNRARWEVEGDDGYLKFFAFRGRTPEQYIEDQGHLSFWACVTPDGKWHEATEMGFWGMSSEVDFHKWETEFADRFLTDPDLILHVIDCHI